MKKNTVIVGSGIAGMTAALYLKRANIDVVIIEEKSPGGQMLLTSTIENYPGLSSIEGPNFAINVYKQLNDLKVEYLYGKVLEININKDNKIVKTDKGNIECQNIIIATGRSSRKLDIENEEELIGKGISYCAICDGSLYKNKDVAVIGGGNSAFEESLYLSKICNKVTILIRSDKIKADKLLLEQVKQTPNINILTNKEVVKIKGNDKLESIIYKDKVLNEEQELNVEGMFIYIGQEPNTSFLDNLGITNEYNYIKTNTNLETDIKGIYAVGDCIDKQVYQIITSASDGAIAATMISREHSNGI